MVSWWLKTGDNDAWYVLIVVDHDYSSFAHKPHILESGSPAMDHLWWCVNMDIILACCILEFLHTVNFKRPLDGDAQMYQNRWDKVTETTRASEAMYKFICTNQIFRIWSDYSCIWTRNQNAITSDVKMSMKMRRWLQTDGRLRRRCLRQICWVSKRLNWLLVSNSHNLGSSERVRSIHFVGSRS